MYTGSALWLEGRHLHDPVSRRGQGSCCAHCTRGGEHAVLSVVAVWLGDDAVRVTITCETDARRDCCRSEHQLVASTRCRRAAVGAGAVSSATGRDVFRGETAVFEHAN